MTLNDLLRKVQALSMQLSSGDVELVNSHNSIVEDVTFEFLNDEGGQRIEMIIWP